MVYASPAELLASKMVALRSQDAPDIVALSETLGLHGKPAAAFDTLFRQVCPDASHLALLLGIPETTSTVRSRLSRKLSPGSSLSNREHIFT